MCTATDCANSTLPIGVFFILYYSQKRPEVIRLLVFNRVFKKFFTITCHFIIKVIENGAEFDCFFDWGVLYTLRTPYVL